jgi:hypothetical protein
MLSSVVMDQPRALAIVPTAVIQPMASAATPLRDAMREILALPIMEKRRAEVKDRVGLHLDADSLVARLEERRSGAKLVTLTTGYDLLAARIIETAAAPGLGRVQAMKLLVEMLEPVGNQLDVRASAEAIAARNGVDVEELVTLAEQIAAGAAAKP